MFCLSKGLGAPVGSILAGPSEFIERAMLWRKRLGGGMRQSGILAACGLVGLKSILPKLGDDHRRAKELGGLLQGISGISVDQSIIVTNFVMIDTDLPSQTWIDALIEYDVHTLPPSPNRIRIVLHHQITDEMIVRVAEIFRSVSAKLVA
jgi:threonine aldolase